MVRVLIETDLAAVLATIAHSWCRSPALPPPLGRVELLEHQVSAVERARASIGEFGGVLLADEVGLGKTYAALAIANGAGSLAVIAPATLIPMWKRSLDATALAADLMSMEALSRGRGAPREGYDIVIIDEAHHARNPATARYAALAKLTRGVPVVLLSATPIHNSRRELAALLALFLGSRARSLTNAELARCVVRRSRDAIAGAPESLLPSVTPPAWVTITHDACMLESLLAIPPPCPPRNGGDGGVLLTLSLIRQWSSSDHALRAALRRRLARADAMADSLAAGRYPNAEELRAWTLGDDAVQLAFPELMSAPTSTDSLSSLEQALAIHRAGVVAALTAVVAAGDRDAERAERLRELRGSHAGQKILAFSQYAETIDAMYQRLRADGGVCALTARGARVSGGQLTRAEALARFAPLAARSRAPARGETIDLLLTTDLLSEGVNLHDASVVVHLDLPWTPARLEQRVGRVVRLGSPHQCIAVYAFAPPASAEVMLGVERRLRAKGGEASRFIGAFGALLPGDGAVGSGRGTSRSPAELTEAIRAVVGAWRTHDPPAVRAEATLAAAVAAREPGVLALVEDAGATVLVAGLGEARPSTDPADVLTTVRLVTGTQVPLCEDSIERATDVLAAWCDARRAARAVAGTDDLGARERVRVLERIAGVVTRAAAHRRPIVASEAARAREAVMGALGAGWERTLAELAQLEVDDERWLAAVLAQVPRSASRLTIHACCRVLAIVVLEPRFA